MKTRYEAKMNQEIGNFECLDNKTSKKIECNYKGMACIKCPKNK